MTDKQLAAFSSVREVLHEADVPWLVTNAACWPVEVAVPASRLPALTLPAVPEFSLAPMDDAAFQEALLARTMTHFRVGGAACEAAGVRWVVTSSLAMVLHGLPDWPGGSMRSALVSDLAFHERMTVPPGVIMRSPCAACAWCLLKRCW